MSLRWPDPASIARRVALLAIGILAWEAMARSGLWSPLIVPSVVQIGYQLWLLVTRPESLVEAWYSVARGLGGFALAAVVGVALGVLMGRSALAAAFFGPVFSGTYPIPKIALFPIFIYLFGIGSLSKVLLIFLECLYPIVITTQAGEAVTWETGQGLPRIEPRDGGYVVVLQRRDAPQTTVELTQVLPGSAAYGVQGGLIAAFAKGHTAVNVTDYLTKR